tara:strand:+ start:225 stop:569 length:345 start_codon:yes stop_codon:yes gene_type:complete
MRYRNYNTASYYSHGRGRSWNAEEAEQYGRYPRTRAAESLGVSVKAFRAGCIACEYVASEWHHVGKFASAVTYYDTEELKADPRFWKGCAEAYKSKAKKDQMNMYAERIMGDAN